MGTKNTVVKSEEEKINLPATISMDDFIDDSVNDNLGAADVIMPRLGILQALSPQLNPRDPSYIEGAKVGQIVNVATGVVADQVDFLPCYYMRHHLEWRPNRGGLVADHGEDESIMNTTRRVDNPQKPGSYLEINAAGNEIIPTATWYGIDLASDMETFIPMAKTQFKSSRDWQTKRTSEKVLHNGVKKNPAYWYRVWHLTTVEREKDGNRWYVWAARQGPLLSELEDAPNLLPRAKRFYEMLKAGSIAVNKESFTDDTDGFAGGGADAPM